MSDSLAVARPRLWLNPKASEDRPTLVRLSGDSLTLAAVPGPDLDQVVAGLEAGGEVAGQVIPLATFRRASGDEDDAELTITFRAGPSRDEDRTIAFADREARVEFAEALARALGRRWRWELKPVSRWSAGAWTLGPSILAGLLTWGLHAEAARIAAGNPPVDWGKGKLRLLASAAHWAESQFGPTGILIGGAALVVLGLLLFVLVMAAPPKRLVVESDEQA